MRTWRDGWAYARGLGAAEEVAAGVLLTRVGAPGRGVELLVLDADERPRRVDLAARASLDHRDPWVTVPTTDPGRTADRLAEHGLATADEPEWLMVRDPTAPQAPAAPAGPVVLPDGYAVAVGAADHRVAVRIAAPDGSLAASGQAGLTGRWAVPDRVATARPHRRRGLGAAVMGSLSCWVAERGADRGVLLASPEGRRLYLALGWRVVGPVVVARRR